MPTNRPGTVIKASTVHDIPPELFVKKKNSLEKMYELFINNPDGYFTQYQISAKTGVSCSGTFIVQLRTLLDKEIIEQVKCPICKRDRVYRLKPKSSQKKKKHS